jgi:hypothetical protein
MARSYKCKINPEYCIKYFKFIDFIKIKESFSEYKNPKIKENT